MRPKLQDDDGAGNEKFKLHDLKSTTKIICIVQLSHTPDKHNYVHIRWWEHSGFQYQQYQNINWCHFLKTLMHCCIAPSEIQTQAQLTCLQQPLCCLRAPHPLQQFTLSVNFSRQLTTCKVAWKVICEASCIFNFSRCSQWFDFC